VISVPHKLQMKSTREANHKTREAGRGEAPCRDDDRKAVLAAKSEEPKPAAQ